MFNKILPEFVKGLAGRFISMMNLSMASWAQWNQIIFIIVGIVPIQMMNLKRLRRFTACAVGQVCFYNDVVRFVFLHPRSIAVHRTKLFRIRWLANKFFTTPFALPFFSFSKVFPRKNSSTTYRTEFRSSIFFSRFRGCIWLLTLTTSFFKSVLLRFSRTFYRTKFWVPARDTFKFLSAIFTCKQTHLTKAYSYEKTVIY